MQFEFKLTSPLRSVESVTLRTITGREERDCRFQAGDDPVKAVDAMVAASIVAVNGKPVQSPYHDWLTWNSKTADCVRAYFNELNAAVPQDVKDPIEECRAAIAAMSLSPNDGSAPTSG